MTEASGDCRLPWVVRGVAPDNAWAVAQLFYVSFGTVLAGLAHPSEREPAITLLAASFCLDEVYAALDDEERVLGVAFVVGRGPVLCVRKANLVRAFGRFGGTWRYAAYQLFVRRRQRRTRDVRGLEAFSVDPTCRGQGVGTAMLDRIIADARSEGARLVKLTTGDVNPARRLYERFGFRVTRTGSVGPFAGRLGFKRFVRYELDL
jgi:GNAT superfamily N-acetyltransferase